MFYAKADERASTMRQNNAAELLKRRQTVCNSCKIGGGVAQLVERQASSYKTLVRLLMRQYVAVSLGKTLNAVSHLGAKQSTHCGGPA